MPSTSKRMSFFTGLLANAAETMVVIQVVNVEGRSPLRSGNLRARALRSDESSIRFFSHSASL